jgi:hypothetical protein
MSPDPCPVSVFTTITEGDTSAIISIRIDSYVDGDSYGITDLVSKHPTRKMMERIVINNPIVFFIMPP